MAIYQTLSYVRDQLYVYLDAGNSSSYSGTGTNWADLSGNGFDFTINASAYTNESIGDGTIKYMNFNGSYGIAKRIVSSALTNVPINDMGTYGVTILCWTRIKDSTADWRTLTRAYGNGNDHNIIVQNGGYQMGMYDNDRGTGFNSTGYNVTDIPGYPYEWHQLCWQFDGSSTAYKFLIDNYPKVLGSNTSDNSRLKVGFACVGGYHNNVTDVNNSAQYFGDIAVFMVYKKVLSTAEIAQNYEYFKARFNRMSPANDQGLSNTNIDIAATIPTPNSSTVGAYLYNDGTNYFWAYPGATQDGPGSGFRYRTLITHGYLAAGYKGSNPWRAVNRTWHATDITIYCGEQLDKAGAYIDGTFSDYNGYVHATNDAFQGAATHTSSYNLSNGIGRARGDGLASPAGSGFGFPTSTGTSGMGGWDMNYARSGGPAGCVNQIGQWGYIGGGGSAGIDKFHFPSEIMYTTGGLPTSYGISSCAHGETKGWYSFSGTKLYVTYSNDSWTSYSNSISPDAWSKILSTKWGFHYGGTGGNVTTGFGKFSDSTGSNITTSLSKPRAYGEENMQMGQNWGYMLGQYDNQQNNHTVRHMHATDALITLGAAAQPKGHFGQSSGACSSAAASILARTSL